MMKKILVVIIAIVGVSSIIGITSNPPENPIVERQIAWDNPQTENLFIRACADCHSNTTNWPWYSTFPPASFLITHNIQEAREEFNISASDIGEADEASEVVHEGEMPPNDYLLLHPEARLTNAEKELLVRGLANTFGEEPNHDDDDDDEDED